MIWMWNDGGVASGGASDGEEYCRPSASGQTSFAAQMHLEHSCCLPGLLKARSSILSGQLQERELELTHWRLCPPSKDQEYTMNDWSSTEKAGPLDGWWNQYCRTIYIPGLHGSRLKLNSNWKHILCLPLPQATSFSLSLVNCFHLRIFIMGSPNKIQEIEKSSSNI